MGASCEFRLLLLFLFLMGSLRLAMSPQDWTYLIDTEPLAISGLRKAAIRNGVPVADAWQESASNKDFSLSAFNSSNWTMTSMTMTSSGSESNEGVCSFGCWGGRCFSISLSVLRGQSHQPSALYHQDPSVTGNVNQSHCHAKMVRYSYYSRTKLGPAESPTQTDRSRGSIEALSSLSHPSIGGHHRGPYPRKATGSSPVARPMH